MELPKATKNWQELMSLFSDETQGLITQLIRQLSPLLKNKPLGASSGAVDPEGFSGITGKQAYERLLFSEWAMQEYNPDEFIRRAISREHLFLQQHRIDQKEIKTCYALFDCGPDQLGKPRLIQMALLILLARRASKAGVDFRWSVLQRTSSEFESVLTEDSINSWLKQRTIEPVTNDHWQHWISILTSASNVSLNSLNKGELFAHNEIWVISPYSIFNENKLNQVIISEPITEPNKITVELASNTTSPPIKIGLPDESQLVSTIRNPFKRRQYQVANTSVYSAKTWVNSPTGRRIALLTRDGNVKLITYGAKANKYEVKEIEIDEKHQCIAIHITKKTFHILCTGDSRYYLYGLNNSNTWTEIAQQQKIPMYDKESKLLPLLVNNDRIHLLDGKGHLRFFDNNQSQRGLLKTSYSDVIKAGRINHCDYTITLNRDSETINISTYLDSPATNSFSIDYTGESPTLFIHSSGNWSKGFTGCLAFENDESWTLIENNKEFSVITPERPLGVIYLSEHTLNISSNYKSNTIALLTLGENNHDINAHGAFGTKTISTLPTALLTGEVNPSHHYLTYYDELNETVIFDFTRDIELLRLSTGIALKETDS